MTIDLYGFMHEWAAWKHRESKRGYPPHSWEGRCQERGGAAPSPAKGHVILTEPNPLAERVDLAVRRLSKREQDVIYVRWLLPQGVRRKAATIGLSGAEYRSTLRQAHRNIKQSLDLRYDPG